MICSTIAGLCLLSYFLFEPIISYNWGWKILPDSISKINNGLHDTTYNDAILHSKMTLYKFGEKGIPGLSIAVGVDNKLVWSEARGYADISDSILATINTQFRIGSVSKAVTSIALGRILEKGELLLTDKVIDYLPEYSYESVTIRQLASHTSGIRNYGACFCFPIWEYYSNDAYESVSKSLKLFKNDPLLFEPGTDFSYSSYNYNLLSAVLEKSYGSSFYHLMYNEVFGPLEMDNTTFDFQDSVFINRAKFYDIDNGEYTSSYTVDNSNKWAGGGLISTPSDLVRMGNALLFGDIINPETFQRLTTPVELTTGEVNEQNYALGWRKHEFELGGIDEKVTIIHHGGTAMGSTALLVIVPDYQLSMAIMMNRSVKEFPLFDLAKPIIAAFIKNRNPTEG